MVVKNYDGWCWEHQIGCDNHPLNWFGMESIPNNVEVKKVYFTKNGKTIAQVEKKINLSDLKENLGMEIESKIKNGDFNLVQCLGTRDTEPEPMEPSGMDLHNEKYEELII